MDEKQTKLIYALANSKEKAKTLSPNQIEQELEKLEEAKEKAISLENWDESNETRETIIGYTEGLLIQMVESHENLDEYLHKAYIEQIPNTTIKDEYHYEDRILLLTNMKLYKLRLKSELG